VIAMNKDHITKPHYGPSPLRAAYRDYLATTEARMITDLLEHARRQVSELAARELAGEQIPPDLTEFRMR
jgi:hypothetical protein